jgi:CcmD family protein
MKKIIFSLLLTLMASISQSIAQNVEMADGLRASGKIYVVVGVLCIIFTGIVVFLINLDSKLSKLKKEVEQLKK